MQIQLSRCRNPAPEGIRRKLRVGLLLDSAQLYAWEHVLLKRIADSRFAEIVLAVIRDPPKNRPTGVQLDPRPRDTGLIGALLGKIYQALEATIACEHDAFALSDNSILSGIPQLRISASAVRANRGHEALDEMQRQSIDVFIELGAHEAGAAMAGVAQHGVWSLRHAHCGHDDAAAAGFWPVYQRWPVIESWVEAIDRNDAVPTMLARSFSAVNPFSAKLCRSALYWKTLSLLPRQLEQLSALSEQDTFSGTVDSEARPIEAATILGSPTARQLAAHVLRNIRRRARDWAYRNFALDRWILLFHVGEELCTSPQRFRKIMPPRDRYWADPCVVRKADRYYVFVEEYLYSTKKGHISVLPINQDGTYAQPIRVLERDFHLSYPCVFEHGNEIFMIPESSENRTVDLYRCVHFPGRWELVKTLLDDISAVDSTVLYHEGKWWLFTNVVENLGASFSEDLFLFHSEDLIHGAWTPHARNPVVSDARRSRPAGRIFRHEGRLCRPAQDCSVRYGYAIVMHEIRHLSEDSYLEIEVASIKPTWDWSIIATHTLSYTPGITVIDGLQPRFKI